MMSTDATPNNLLRLPELRQRLGGLSRSAIYLLMRRGMFPRPIRLTPQVVAWRERDIIEWIDRCPPSTGGPSRCRRQRVGHDAEAGR
jgi:prophage regulatory protein